MDVVLCIDNVLRDGIERGDLMSGDAARDLIERLGHDSLSESSVFGFVLTPASSEVATSVPGTMIDDFGLSTIARRNVRSMVIIRTANDQVCQYPTDESSRPPIIGPKKPPEFTRGPMIPIVFPILAEPTVSAIVANAVIQSTDAAAPWKTRLKHRRYTEMESLSTSKQIIGGTGGLGCLTIP